VKRYVRELSGCTLFDGFTADEIDRILSATPHTVREYSKGDLILLADRRVESLGIVMEGMLDIRNNLESGKCFNILYLNPGETFGGPLLFSDTPSSGFEISAKTRCTVLYIHRNELLRLIRNEDRATINLLRIFSHTVLMLNKKIELFSDSSIRKKIAFVLLYHSESKNTPTIELPLSKQSWAEHLNVSRPSLSRELSSMEEEGMIRISGRRITITDRDRLEQIISV